jgi:uncharacterized membrane protein YgcG
MRRTALWILAAVAGVLVVAGVTAAASTLSTQSVGLSSEPLTAGDELAPTATPTPRKADDKRRNRSGRATPTPTPTIDDHGGSSGSDDHGGSSGRSGSSGHGSDDHGGHGSDD